MIGESNISDIFEMIELYPIVEIIVYTTAIAMKSIFLEVLWGLVTSRMIPTIGNSSIIIAINHQE